MNDEFSKRFKDLPGYIQLYLSALLADVNYLRGQNMPLFQNEDPDSHYALCKRKYEEACRREGVNPYEQE